MKSLLPWRQGHKHAALTRRNNWFDHFLPALIEPFPAHIPTVDVSEDRKEVRVRAEIPGMTEKDIQLTWHDGVLRIYGEKKEEKEEKKDYYYKESRYGSFCRDIPLGSGLDWKNAQAKYKNGVLTITMPKTGETSKAIEVKIS